MQWDETILFLALIIDYAVHGEDYDCGQTANLIKTVLLLGELNERRADDVV